MEKIVTSSSKAERLVKVVSVLSFVMMCWVIHRALEVRSDCLNSSFLAFVEVQGQRAPNCRLENKLGFHEARAIDPSLIRPLEVLEPLVRLLNPRGPRVAVEINTADPKIFELGRGYLRLGEAWLTNTVQTRRALVMAVLQSYGNFSSQFQLETVTDFLMLAAFGDDNWLDEEGQVFSLSRDLKFPTTGLTFSDYCRSPFRSLSHETLCQLGEGDHAWALRPLLAVSLWRVYDQLPLKDRLTMMHALVSGAPLTTPDPKDPVDSFREVLLADVSALIGRDARSEVERTLKVLAFERPTRWELTLDVTHTPAWREILDQMRQRARLVQSERVLIFTPEGALALPSGLPVAWKAADIRSQKHVMIACEWPKPQDTVHVRARHLFAQQSCDKLTNAFWSP